MFCSYVLATTDLDHYSIPRERAIQKTHTHTHKKKNKKNKELPVITLTLIKTLLISYQLLGIESLYNSYK